MKYKPLVVLLTMLFSVEANALDDSIFNLSSLEPSKAESSEKHNKLLGVPSISVIPIFPPEEKRPIVGVRLLPLQEQYMFIWGDLLQDVILVSPHHKMLLGD